MASLLHIGADGITTLALWDITKKNKAYLNTALGYCDSESDNKDDY